MKNRSYEKAGSAGTVAVTRISKPKARDPLLASKVYAMTRGLDLISCHTLCYSSGGRLALRPSATFSRCVADSTTDLSVSMMGNKTQTSKRVGMLDITKRSEDTQADVRTTIGSDTRLPCQLLG